MLLSAINSAKKLYGLKSDGQTDRESTKDLYHTVLSISCNKTKRFRWIKEGVKMTFFIKKIGCVKLMQLLVLNWYIFQSMIGFTICPLSSKTIIMAARACSEGNQAYILIPSHLGKISLLWFDLKTHRGADTTNILNFLFVTIFYLMKLW